MRPYQVRLPDDNGGRLPDAEEVLVTLDGVERAVRLHDYATFYAVPGLYTHIIGEVLACRSPEVLATLLVSAVRAAGHEVPALTVLDLGAGSGLGGAALMRHGIRRLIGVDIVPEARRAATREVPGLYAAYLVAEFAVDAEAVAAVAALRPTCLLCLSAIGLGHVPPAAFRAAYGLLPLGGWIAFNIKEDFLHHDTEGFAGLIGQALTNGTLEEHRRQRYVHRRHVDGRALVNVAMVGRKRGELATPPAPPEGC